MQGQVALGEALPAEWLADDLGPADALARLESPIADPASIRGLLTTLNTRVDEAVLARFPGLRCVSNMAVGYDNIDVAACSARGIAVGHTPGVLTNATADLCFALLLCAARGILPAANDAKAGRWGQWTPTGWLGRDLAGAKLGIVGFGAIGQAVARRARAFGMELFHHSRSPKHQEAATLGSTALSLEALLATAEVISLHVPMTPETQALLGREQFKMMRADALLINTARGGVIDQTALVTALQTGQIAGAALDVTSPEPLPVDHPLFAIDTCLITPHIGSAAASTRRAMCRLACDNLREGLAGRPLPHQVPEQRAPRA